MMGIGIVAAISAPTSLAVNMAQDKEVTLAGFMRDQSYVIYAHPWRIR
jgi:FdhD protein